MNAKCSFSCFPLGSKETWVRVISLWINWDYFNLAKIILRGLLDRLWSDHCARFCHDEITMTTLF